jgi:hypothetical protein
MVVIVISLLSLVVVVDFVFAGTVLVAMILAPLVDIWVIVEEVGAGKNIAPILPG